MRSAELYAVGLLAAAVSAVTHLVALGYFVIGTCAVSDQSDTFPAPASPQGLVCDAGRADSWWGIVGYAALAVSAVLAVVLVLLAWRRGGRARWWGVLALLGLPVLTLVLLGLPPDSCSDADRRTHPAYDCATTSTG